MRRHASGVCLVATSYENARYVSTLTSVSSLSMEPPALIFCINRGASIHAPLNARGLLSVNVLSAQQVALARRCSGSNGASGEARFEGAAWRVTANGIPILLDGALVVIEAHVQERWIGGTHTVFMCVVDHVELLDRCNSTTPLVYANGDYGSLGPLCKS